MSSAKVKDDGDIFFCEIVMVGSVIKLVRIITFIVGIIKFYFGIFLFIFSSRLCKSVER